MSEERSIENQYAWQRSVIAGNVIGSYRLVRAIRRGGFATVYLGEHQYLNTQVAIKVIWREHNDVTRFLTEARMHARMHHPNIVRVIDFGIQSEYAYLITDYASSGTLADYFPQGVVFPLQAVLPYFLQTVEALGYIHHRNMVHRDIKPQNILLGPENRIWLSDFGFTTAAQPWNHQFQRDSVGTAAYAAPEQIRGMPLTASDQYSLAIIVYSWLTGRLPFVGTTSQLCDQHLHVFPPRLRQHVPSIAPAVENVVMKALSKDPYRRYASIQEFANALYSASQKPERTTEPFTSLHKTPQRASSSYSPLFDPPRKQS